MVSQFFSKVFNGGRPVLWEGQLCDLYNSKFGKEPYIGVMVRFPQSFGQMVDFQTTAKDFKNPVTT